VRVTGICAALYAPENASLNPGRLVRGSGHRDAEALCTKGLKY
jgi:hypothetical protein